MRLPLQLRESLVNRPNRSPNARLPIKYNRFAPRIRDSENRVQLATFVTKHAQQR